MRERVVVGAAFLRGQLFGPLVELRRHLRRLFRRAAQGDEQRGQFGGIHFGKRSWA